MNVIRKNTFFLVGLVLTLALLWPLFVAPYFTHQDDVQVIRLFEMNKCVADGQIPCRWVPDLGGLYGYPLFNYYGPLPYYFGEAVYLMTGSLLISAKVMFGISFIGAFWFMYLFARKFWGQLGGAISAIFYSYAPYHSVDLYVRGAMAELWGLMFLPLVLWSVVRLKEKSSLVNVIVFALSMAGLLTSHNLSTFMFAPIIGGFIVIILFSKSDLGLTKSAKFIKTILISLILGLALAAFYWMPMLVEKPLVHVETTIEGYFSYTEHFKGLRKLFLDRYWGYGSSIREVPGGEKDNMPYQIGWVHLAGWGIAILAAGLVFIKKVRIKATNFNISLVVGYFSLVIVICVFLIHPSSLFVWKLIDPMKYIQFPWRFLGLIIFSASFLAGAVFVVINDKYRLILGAILLILVVSLNFSYFRPEKFLYYTDQSYLSGDNWVKQIDRSIFDFLPIYAKAPPANLATSEYQILTGQARILDFSFGSDWQEFNLTALTDTTIQLSRYYFPDWKVFANGSLINIHYDNPLGLITFDLGKGNYKVTARLFNTPIRLYSNLISLSALIIILILVARGYLKKQLSTE